MELIQEILGNLFNQQLPLIVGAWTGLPLTLLLIVCLVKKNNRDERGWKIIGKASLITFVYFMIMANLMAKIVGSSSLNITYLFFANTIQWLYNTMVLMELALIQILKRIE